MMSKFKYPVDTDQFQEIREQGELYVDKTGQHKFHKNNQVWCVEFFRRTQYSALVNF